MNSYLLIFFRDLKPENCMLSDRGHIVLTDFGSAKMLELSEKTTTIAGTPQYIAPEVLRGEPYSFSADWWSCGILLYELLVGKPPFYSSDRVELYRLVLRGDFQVPKTVSPRGRALLYRVSHVMVM
jgi:serine/threonine protein kinase